jgi:hypothetical protein
VKARTVLPEVTLLYDARGARPENAVGVAGFWYEPEVWSLPLSPTARVLYASLCSFLGHGQINRKDLRASLKACTDEEIAAAHEDLVHHGHLVPSSKRIAGETLPGYTVRPVNKFEG